MMNGAYALLVLCVFCWLSSGYAADANVTREADVVALVNLTFGWKENTQILRSLWNIQADGSHASDPCVPKPWNGLICEFNNQTGYHTVIRITLNNQSLTGNLPTQLYDLTGLTTISLRHNNLTGEISNYNFSRWANFTSLILRNNQLTGTSPTVPTSMQSLDLSENNFIGPIPDDWFNGGLFTKLQELYLSHNQFAKSFPQPIDSQLLFLDINSNNFYGQLPYINSNSMPKIQIMHLDDNHFSSGFSNITNLPSLTILTLSGNPVKFLNDSFFNAFPNLYQFHCANCKLTSSLPTSISNLTAILDFNHNFLTGSLPDSWSNTRLGWILVSNNDLTGSIPESWGLLLKNSLRQLDISFNRLTGSYPSWLKNDPTGGNFVFNSKCNEFSGDLPMWCKDSEDCVSCGRGSGDGEDDRPRGYLWFLLFPSCLMCCLILAVAGFFGYRYKMKAGYDAVEDRL